MLFHDDVSMQSCSAPCATGSTATSTTKAFTSLYKHSGDGKGFAYFDTVGLGDAKVSDKESISALRGTITKAQIGFHVVLVVLKYGRAGLAERSSIRALRSIFSDDDWRRNAVLVLTHCNEEIVAEDESQEQDRELAAKWAKDDPDLQKLIDVFGNVIVTDNGNAAKRLEQANRPLRQRCLNMLTKIRDSAEVTIKIRPMGLVGLIDYVLEKYLQSFIPAGAKKNLERIKNTEVALLATDKRLATAPGEECSICLARIPLDKLSHLDGCTHVFHRDCIQRHCTVNASDCPNCRQAVGTIYYFSLATGPGWS